jgi:hypothetical protein
MMRFVSSRSLSLEGSGMSDLSIADQLYLNVGKCLTAWNRVEEHVLYLIEYANTTGGYTTPDISVGYWAVVSFEARLKWCDAVVSFSTRGDAYSDLARRWNALENKLREKARKRAEIAHGSVVSLREAGHQAPQTHFVPYFHRRKLEHQLRPLAEHQISPEFFKNIATLSVENLTERVESFLRLRRELVNFQTDWMSKDKETGYRE